MVYLDSLGSSGVINIIFLPIIICHLRLLVNYSNPLCKKMDNKKHFKLKYSKRKNTDSVLTKANCQSFSQLSDAYKSYKWLANVDLPYVTDIDAIFFYLRIGNQLSMYG